MKKKTKLIILIIVGVVAFYAVCTTGYLLLSARIDNIDKRSFTSRAEEYLSSNEDFVEQYGNLKSLESDDKRPIDTDNENELYMDFYCVTDKTEFSIRVYRLWTEDGFVYSYIVS